MNRNVTAIAALALSWASVAAQEQEAATRGKAESKSTAQDAKSTKPTVLAVGSPVPTDLVLTDSKGKEFAFKDQKGKVVMVHFWSTSCPWEKQAEPKLNQLATDFKGKDVVCVAINANGNEIGQAPDAAAFAAKEDKDRPYYSITKHLDKLNHAVLFDHTGDAARLFGAKTTPHCFVIDSKGVLAYAGGLDNNGKAKEGDVEASGQYVRLAIDALLAGKPVETSTSRPYG